MPGPRSFPRGRVRPEGVGMSRVGYLWDGLGIPEGVWGAAGIPEDGGWVYQRGGEG